ncbi:MAG TPA: hypothetical protein VIY30_14945, partial [Burkholderiaceae bacterium]
MTFAEVVEQIRVGDSSHSCVPTDNRDEFAAERLHPLVANWHCRPVAVACAAGLSDAFCSGCRRGRLRFRFDGFGRIAVIGPPS